MTTPLVERLKDEHNQTETRCRIMCRESADRIERLEKALREIQDHKPDEIPFDSEEWRRSVEACSECPQWKTHPIQQYCHEHMRQLHRSSDARNDAENREKWQMRAIARKALEET